MNGKPTACILCECNCGIVVQLEGRKLAKIRGDKEHPASQGYTCNKALRLDHYQNNSSRLTSPMRRRPDGSYEEIDWDTAITEIAEGFKHIRDAYGGDKIFYYGGGGQGNHLGGAYSGAFLKAHRFPVPLECAGAGEDRGSTGSTRISTAATPAASSSTPRCRCSSARTRGCRRASRAPASCSTRSPRIPTASMIVIDPVITDTAKMADFHLRVRPGTDAWCLAAMAAVLVQENLCNEEFLAEHVNGVDAVREVLRDGAGGRLRASAAASTRSCCAPRSRRIARADSVAVFEDLGIQQAPNSTLCSYLNKLLWILTGNFAKRGGQHLHSSFAPLFAVGGVGRTPVTGAPVIAGLVPSQRGARRRS